MDMKLIVVVLVASLAFAGAVYAMPGLHAGLDNWLGRNASMQNGTWHGRGAMQNGSWAKVGFGRCGNSTAFQNGTWGGCGANSTQRANATEISDFQQAVMNGDYQTAKQLHDQYGLGGLIFGRLNETTFADYSDINNLAAKLGQELGIGNPSFFGMGVGVGFAGGMHHPHRGRPLITSNN